MDLSLLKELIYIKSIPINSENESLIREKIQHLFLKAAKGQKKSGNISEAYYRKTLVTGCRGIIKEIKNFKILTEEKAVKEPVDIFSLLRPAAAACTFLLSPSVTVSSHIPDSSHLRLLCSADTVLWCALTLIGAAASITENGKINISAWETKSGGAVKVSGSLFLSLSDLEEELSQCREAELLCRKTADLHRGQCFRVYENHGFSLGFTISSPKIAPSDAENPPAATTTVYDLLSDRLSPLYAALNDAAPCLL